MPEENLNRFIKPQSFFNCRLITSSNFFIYFFNLLPPDEGGRIRLLSNFGFLRRRVYSGFLNEIKSDARFF